MINEKLNLNTLLSFSKTYKTGFTFQYNNKTGLFIDVKKNKKYPYIISYKTLLEIKTINEEKYIITVYEDVFNYIDYNKKHNFIIGGFYDKTNNTYYIEVNTYEFTLNQALITGKLFKQKAIYNNITGEVISIDNKLKIPSEIIITEWI